MKYFVRFEDTRVVIDPRTILRQVCHCLLRFLSAIYCLLHLFRVVRKGQIEIASRILELVTSVMVIRRPCDLYVFRLL